MILANEEALTRPYQYYITVCLSVPPTKQFCEAPVVTLQWFVCLSVAMTTSEGNGYGTQSIAGEPLHNIMSDVARGGKPSRIWKYTHNVCHGFPFIREWSSIIGRGGL